MSEIVAVPSSRLAAARAKVAAIPQLINRFIRIVLAAICLWLWNRWVNHKRHVINGDWMELEFAPRELQAERETVQNAVKQDWRALEFASEELRNDKEIVGEAVLQSWRALRFASLGLRADRDLVLGAVQQSSGWALEFAAEELYQDPELMREATTRLGGPLGLPLTPIMTLVPAGQDGEEEAGNRTAEETRAGGEAPATDAAPNGGGGGGGAAATSAAVNGVTVGAARGTQEHHQQQAHSREGAAGTRAAATSTNSATSAHLDTTAAEADISTNAAASSSNLPVAPEANGRGSSILRHGGSARSSRSNEVCCFALFHSCFPRRRPNL